MTTVSAALARFAVGPLPASAPAAVREAARLHLLDTVGCAAAAFAEPEVEAVRDVYASAGGSSQATAIGVRDALPAPAAAMVNGTAAHTLDFDGTHQASICHAGAVVAPAAIAVAELTEADGATLLDAFLVGCETACRIGMAAPGGFHARGFHPTSVCGVFGATAAAGRLLGLDADRLTAAFGLAGSLASGLFECLADGSPTKPLHAGWAARSGVEAALLSAAGARGPASVLEGRYGLYRTHTDGHVDLAAPIADLGDRWETAAMAIKPYPACHFVHGAVDAAVQATAGAQGLEIASATVSVPDGAVPIVLEPVADKRTPRNPYDARFSLQYSLAARLTRGSLGVRDYRLEAIDDPATLALAARVTHTPWRGDVPSPFAGRVVIRLTDGRELRGECAFPPGAPENPLTPDAVLEKFRANATPALSEAADALAASLLDLDDVPDVRAVFRPLALVTTPTTARS